MRTIMFNLLAYPHTLEKLYDKLCSAGLSRPFPRYSEVRDLPYLDACVQEGARIHPPFALPFERVVPEDGVTVLGHYIPPGTVVGGNPYVVNRHRPTFGQDAEFWGPERWVDKNEALIKNLEQGVLTVSLTFCSLVYFSLTHLFQVRCRPARLSRQACRNFGDQETHPGSCSKLRCEYSLITHAWIPRVTNV